LLHLVVINSFEYTRTLPVYMFWFVIVGLGFFNEVSNSVFMFPQRRMLG